MFAIAIELLNIFMAFSRDKNEGFLNGSICSISDVREKVISVFNE